LIYSVKGSCKVVWTSSEEKKPIYPEGYKKIRHRSYEVFKMIPDEFRNLMDDETKAYAFLATIMQDSTPQVTPVWFDVEDDLIRINTVRGRVKDRNMTARPDVALTIMDLQDPLRYMQVRGVVKDSSEVGAREHIDKLAYKYRGTEAYEWYKGETRVIYRIHVNSVQTMG
jgi:PPOX class probable F420-dependent enzyme